MTVHLYWFDKKETKISSQELQQRFITDKSKFDIVQNELTCILYWEKCRRQALSFSSSKLK